MSRATEDRNRRMRRARDTMDRAFAQPLDVQALARVAHVSPAHFSRQFRAISGESPQRYLQGRRVERAMERRGDLPDRRLPRHLREVDRRRRRVHPGANRALLWHRLRAARSVR
ncbi:MAG: helix-turn-helix domain-containing protein [Solirubrobacterales bacterium]|nr:helix-turn-helix domain-containing protein [Solirubrobacterales bacterium]MBV9716016.1 helix-turn-helix domain-containing protein [Solirubrobacterales bacterium]